LLSFELRLEQIVVHEILDFLVKDLLHFLARYNIKGNELRIINKLLQLAEFGDALLQDFITGSVALLAFLHLHSDDRSSRWEEALAVVVKLADG